MEDKSQESCKEAVFGASRSQVRMSLECLPGHFLSDEDEKEQDSSNDFADYLDQQDYDTTVVVAAALSCVDEGFSDKPEDPDTKPCSHLSHQDGAVIAEDGSFASSLLPQKSNILVLSSPQLIGPKTLIDLVVSCPCCQTSWDEPMPYCAAAPLASNHHEAEALDQKATPSDDAFAAKYPSRLYYSPYHRYPPRQSNWMNPAVSSSSLQVPSPFGRNGVEEARARRKSLIRDDEDEDEQDILPSVLASGVFYRPKRILVEGWLYKKGSGRDWMGSRAWKSRWARLTLASIDPANTSEGGDADVQALEVPLLLLYWYPASFAASTVLVLDSTVIMSEDATGDGDKDTDRWNAHRFAVRYVAKGDSDADQVNGDEPPCTRSFAAPRKARDAWVYAMSQALLSFEKQKDQLRKQAAQREAQSRFLTAQANRDNSFGAAAPSGPQSLPPDSSIFSAEDVWAGERNIDASGGVSPHSPPRDRLVARRNISSSPRLPRPTRPGTQRRTSKVSPTSGEMTAALNKAPPALMHELTGC